jgi:hypothetical protein
MIRVKKVILRNTSIMLKDEKNLEEFRGQLAELLDVDLTQVTFTHDELAGYLEEDDPCLKTIKKLKEAPVNKNVS